MSANPEVDGIVTLPASEEPVAAPIAVQVPALPIRKGPGWAVVAAVAAIAVIMSGSLGYFLYATLQQREVLQARLVSASATLASTQADLANRKVTATYVALYVADNGKVETDYETFVNCNDYSTCRTAAQQMLSDLQAFQVGPQVGRRPVRARQHRQHARRRAECSHRR